MSVSVISRLKIMSKANPSKQLSEWLTLDIWIYFSVS